MNIAQSFSLNAQAYEEVNVIQNRVIEALMGKIDDKPASLLDIGCGSGGILKAATWEISHYVGIDFAEGMLALHPKGKHIQLLHRDFNDLDTFHALKKMHFDRIVSASALQWADDLEAVLAAIAALNAPVSLAIFTSDTFKTLYETASLDPILRHRDEVTTLLGKYFHGEIEILRYTLTFDSVRDMFRYMKRSGVGAGRNVLSYKAMKSLMREYPLDYLEYEIVLLHEKRAAVMPHLSK